MKILVTIKRVPDPEQRLKFKGDGFDLAGVNYVINPFDEYAVETALRLNENGASPTQRLGEVVVLSVGAKEVQQQLRSCLAMGADRAILVEVPEATLDPEQVARVVAKVVANEKPDLLLMGKQAVDDDSMQAAQLAAGYLGWPQACAAATVELAADKKSLNVGREVDAGVETKRVPLPAMVSVDLRIVQPKAVVNHVTPDGFAYPDQPRYASLKGIMAAKKKPIQELGPQALGLDLKPRVKLLRVEAPPARKAGIKVKTVEELVDKLHTEAKVL